MRRRPSTPLLWLAMLLAVAMTATTATASRPAQTCSYAATSDSRSRYNSPVSKSR